MGALIPLIYPESWQKSGDLTTDEAAEEFLNILWEAYADDEGECPTVPAPWWDTVADADDEYPEGEIAPWYGTAIVTYASPPDVTFIETLGIWAIAGFIVYSGAPLAAISFLTIAPKFVIALKTGDLGGIVDLIVDASRVGRYDTHSDVDGIMRIAVAGNPDLDTHQIYLVKDDDPDTIIAVVRDELNPGDVAPLNRRYNPTDNSVEILNPDGTWTASSAADPRSSPAFQYAPPAADDPACQAAANMSRWLNDVIDQTLTVIAEANDAAGLLTILIALLDILGPFAILIDLVLGLASVLFSAGATAIDAAFTNDVYDQLTCIFFCNVDPDGVVTPEALATIQASIDAQIGGLVATVLDAALFLTGNVGLTNAGAVGDAPADCDACACGWCYEWPDAASIASGYFTQLFDPQGGQSVFYNVTFDVTTTITQIKLNFTSGGAAGAAALWCPIADRIALFTLGAPVTEDIWYNQPGFPEAPIVSDGVQFGANGNFAGDVTTLNSFCLEGTGPMPAFTGGHLC